MRFAERHCRPGVLRLLVVALAACLVTGCSSGDDGSSKRSAKDEPAAQEQKSASMSLSEVLAADLAYSRFNQVFQASGLASELDGADAVTLLVPNDAAMATLGEDALASLADPERAAAFVRGHSLDGSSTVTDLLNAGGAVTDRDGGTWKVAVADGRPMIGGAGFAVQDIATRNGYVQVIDALGDVTRASG